MDTSISHEEEPLIELPAWKNREGWKTLGTVLGIVENKVRALPMCYGKELA